MVDLNIEGDELAIVFAACNNYIIDNESKNKTMGEKIIDLDLERWAKL